MFLNTSMLYRMYDLQYKKKMNDLPMDMHRVVLRVLANHTLFITLMSLAAAWICIVLCCVLPLRF